MISGLRFIERDGKKILQTLVQFGRTNINPVTKAYESEIGMEWQDVPLISEEKL